MQFSSGGIILPKAAKMTLQNQNLTKNHSNYEDTITSHHYLSSNDNKVQIEQNACRPSLDLIKSM